MMFYSDFRKFRKPPMEGSFFPKNGDETNRILSFFTSDVHLVNDFSYLFNGNFKNWLKVK